MNNCSSKHRSDSMHEYKQVEDAPTRICFKCGIFEHPLTWDSQLGRYVLMGERYVIRGMAWSPRPMYLSSESGDRAEGNCYQLWTTWLQDAMFFPTEAAAMEYGSQMNGRLTLEYVKCEDVESVRSGPHTLRDFS